VRLSICSSAYLKRASGLALGGLIKALILLILLLTVLLVPMPNSFFADLCLPASDPKTEA
jgi:hypothetical protein